MATIEDAQRLAQRKVIDDSLRTGTPWRAWIEEFADGWVIWTTPPRDELPAIGAGNRSVLDRRTGEVTHWPALSSADVIAAYRARIPVRPVDAPRTVDASAVLAADRRLLSAPNVQVSITDERGGVRQSVGCKAEVAIEHHPLVRQWLSQQPTGSLECGAERQAELIALSDLLYELDFRRSQEAAPALERDTARELLSGYQAQVHALRPNGHPQHAAKVLPTDTGIRAWVEFGLASPSALLFAEPITPTGARQPPEPDRFPADVATALADGGWGEAITLRSGRPFDPGRWAQFALEILGEAVDGRYRIMPLESARAAITGFPRLSVQVKGPGRDHWVRPFTLAVQPELSRYADVLGDFGQVIDAPLVPIGEDDGGGVIAVDDLGRVFLLDQTGEYCYGTDLDSALVAIIRGTEPTRITW